MAKKVAKPKKAKAPKTTKGKTQHGMLGMHARGRSKDPFGHKGQARGTGVAI